MQMQDGDWRLLLTTELGFLACLLLCDCFRAWHFRHNCLALEGTWLFLERSLPISHAILGYEPEWWLVV